MKKKIVAMMTVCALAGMTFTACGKENNAESLSKLDCEKYVTIGEYKGVEVEVTPINVTDDDVQSTIDSYAQSALKEENVVTEGTVAEGDTARIDYVGTKDGVAFDGGSATGYDLEIGSGAFIPGFEDGLVGVEVGNTVVLDLTFPEEYSNEELAGQAVQFEVTVQGIVETVVKDLTDETAGTVAESIGVEATDLASLKVAVKEYLTENEENSRLTQVKNDATKIVYENLTVIDVPEFLSNRLFERMDNSLTQYATMYGMDAATLASYQFGIDAENYTEYLTEMCKEYAAEYIAFQQIAVAEGLTVSDDEVKAKAEEDYAMYGYESVDAYLEAVSLDEYRDDIMFDKVLNFIAENATLIEKEASVEETEATVETEETVAETETAETETAAN